MSGAVVFITGLPSSGKSTLGEAALAALRKAGTCACLLDGDAVRGALVPAPGYTPSERDAFYATLANLAGLLADQGLVVVVAATANLVRYREAVRARVPVYLEVHVGTSIDQCRERDAKGLYASREAGHLRGVPGADAVYEPPAAPDVVASGGFDSAAVEAILRRLGPRAAC